LDAIEEIRPPFVESATPPESKQAPSSVLTRGDLRLVGFRFDQRLTLLERVGLVSLASRTGKGLAQALSVTYDEIQMTIDLRQSREASSA